MSDSDFRNELRVVSLLELSEALEKDGSYSLAAEHLCGAANILVEEPSNRSKAQRCLLRAKGLDPENPTVQLLLESHFPILMTVKNPPVVIDAFSFPDDPEGGSSSSASFEPMPPSPTPSATNSHEKDSDE